MKSTSNLESFLVEATLNSVSGEFGEWFVMMGQNDGGIMGFPSEPM